MKRPLLLMFVCFVLGEICILLSEWWIAMALGIVWACILLIRMRKLQMDCKWLLAPLFFWMGALICYDYAAPRALDAVIQDTVDKVKVQGQVYQWEETTNGVRLYLQDGRYAFVCNQTQYYGQFKHGLLVYTEEYTGKLGQQVSVEGSLQLLEHATNPGSFDTYQYWKARNIDYSFYAEKLTFADCEYWHYRQMLREVRDQFKMRLEKLFPNVDQGVLAAMILGDKSDLDKEIKTLYQKAGIAHIIAISGLHVGLIGVALFQFLRKCKLGYVLPALLSGSLIISYAWLTGMSGSTKRAMIMLLVSFGGHVLGKGYDLLTSMAFAGFWILADAPFMLMDAGFLLSFGAIAGIGAVYPALEKGYERGDNGERFQGKFCKRIRQSVFISISIQLATLPVIAHYYYEFPLYSVCLNVIVIPLMSVLVPVAVFAVAGSYLWMPAAEGLVLIAKGILFFYQAVSELSLRLPIATVLTGKPRWWQIVIYYIALVVILYAIMNKQYAPILLACSVVLAAMLLPLRKPVEVTMLDVGQGDGLVVRTVSGKTILVDGGSSSEAQLWEYTYLPYLKSQRIRKVDMVIISHSDLDHISAIEELIPQWEVGLLCLPAIANPNENYMRLLAIAKEYGVAVTYLSAGMQFVADGVTFECIFPKRDGLTQDVNANSTVIYMQYQDFAMLFTGDLTQETELEALGLLSEDNRRNLDVLKVAHHGSKSSTSQEFLDGLGVKYAIVSAGKNNRYGHPHKEVLNRLYDSGTKVLVTADSGAIIIESDGTMAKLTQYYNSKSCVIQVQNNP